MHAEDVANLEQPCQAARTAQRVIAVAGSECDTPRHLKTTLAALSQHWSVA